MRVAQLILVQPNGEVKRLVVCDQGGGTDQSIIASLCESMADDEFRAKLPVVDERQKQQLLDVVFPKGMLAKA